MMLGYVTGRLSVRRASRGAAGTRAAVVLVLLAVSGCVAKIAPTSRVVAAPTLPLPPEPPPLPIERAPTATAKAVPQGVWFAEPDGGCSGAVGVRAPLLKLELPPASTQGMTVSMQVAGGAAERASGSAKISFHGESGIWEQTSTIKHGEIKVGLPNNPATMSKLLALLEGGNVSAAYGGNREQMLVPRAGAAEQRWFECAQKSMVH